jgi:hypothetical protein
MRTLKPPYSPIYKFINTHIVIQSTYDGICDIKISKAHQVNRLKTQGEKQGKRKWLVTSRRCTRGNRRWLSGQPRSVPAAGSARHGPRVDGGVEAVGEVHAAPQVRLASCRPSAGPWWSAARTLSGECPPEGRTSSTVAVTTPPSVTRR